MRWEPGQSGNKTAQWKPGQFGKPSGKSAQIEAAPATVREFMVNGGNLTAWMVLVLDKDPKVRMYVFRALAGGQST